MSEIIEKKKITPRKIMFHLNCLHHGGAERVVSNLANRFAEAGYEVVVAVEWIDEVEYPLDPRIKHPNVGLQPEDEGKNRIAKYLLRVKRLKQCIKEEKPDVVIAFAHLAIYRALMAAHHTGVPVIIAVRTNPIDHYEGKADKIQIPWLFPRAAGAVWQTTGQRDFFKPHLQEDKSTIILNPLNNKYLNVEPPAERTKTVAQVGRVEDFKCQPMLVDAFEKVHEKHPDWILKIYGGDSGDGTWQILESKIKEYNASAYVKLMGDCDTLEKELNDVGVFAFSSEWEGLPNALMEAMALGLPTVATDCPCGGPATIIKDGENGLLVPIWDPNALAEGICRLIEDRDLAERLGQEARKIADIACPDVVYEKWADYIERVVGENK